MGYGVWGMGLHIKYVAVVHQCRCRSPLPLWFVISAVLRHSRGAGIQRLKNPGFRLRGNDEGWICGIAFLVVQLLQPEVDRT
jgi:hypothetical protein